jgi:hypothetical protein
VFGVKRERKRGCPRGEEKKKEEERKKKRKGKKKKKEKKEKKERKKEKILNYLFLEVMIYNLY